MNKIDRGGARRRARPAGDRREADAGDRRDGIGARPRHPRRRLRAVRRGRPRVHRQAGRAARRARRRAAGRVRRRRGDGLRTAGCAARSPRRPGGRWCIPVFFGSAITGAGVDALTAGITELLPAAEGDADGPVSGTVFKVERGPAGEKIAYVRMFSGTLRDARPAAVSAGDGRRGRSPRSACSTAARPSARASVAAGQIGEALGPRRRPDRRRDRRHRATASGRHHFAPPTLETVVVPAPRRRQGRAARRARPARRAGPADQPAPGRRPAGALRLALRRGAEGGHPGDAGRTTSASRSSSARRRRSASNGRPAPARPSRSSAQAPNPFLATVGLRVEPAPIGSGVEFRLRGRARARCRSRSSGRSRTPCSATLRQGLYGWQVTDCMVTHDALRLLRRGRATPTRFDKSMSSTGGDFRNLTPLVLMSALQQAGTVVCEPMHRFRLEVPADTLGPRRCPRSARLRAVPQTHRRRAGSACVLEGEIPAARRARAAAAAAGADARRGRARVAPSTATSRCAARRRRAPRTDHNPLNRKEYLLHVVRQGT